MKMENPSAMWQRALPVVLLLILIALVAIGALLLQLKRDIVRCAEEGARADDLPCAALPTRFVLGAPECAQKLLDAMNISNVRVRAGDTT
ncbi:MAG: hypothetical protein JXQ75_04700 [Phycisphaerae bacterium]|nr:hypothetical protein [Phycisphaerae bacterium]